MKRGDVTISKIINCRTRASKPPKRPPVTLSWLKSGMVRSVKLFLFRSEDKKRLPTSNFLNIQIACQEQKRSFYFDVDASFKEPPRSARLTVIKGRRDRLDPVWLVKDHRSQGTVSFPFEIDPATERIILFVETEGSDKVPNKLAAMLHNRAL